MINDRIKVRVISDDQCFQNIHNQWDNLLGRSSLNSVFMTWEFLFLWWQAYKYDKQLLIILVYDNNTLVGIAPLYKMSARQFGLRKRVHLEFLGGSETFFEGLDFIIESGREREITTIFFDYLFGVSDIHWDILNLTSVRETSTIYPHMMNYLLQKHCPAITYAKRDCLVAQFPETFAEYLSTLSKGTRDKLKYYSRKMFKLPDIKFEVANVALSSKESFASFVRIHQLRQVSKGNEGSFRESRKNYLNFHENLINHISELGWCYFFFLRSGEQVIAGMYCYCYKNNMYGYALGFDPTWEEYRPGNVLRLHAFEYMINNHIKSYDFIRGVTPHKLQWTKNILHSLDTVIWRSSKEYKMFIAESTIRSITKYFMPKGVAKQLYTRLFGRATT